MATPRTDWLAAYNGNPTKSLFKARMHYHADKPEQVLAWIEDYRQQGYTEVLAWTVVGAGQSEAHLLAEKPACK